MIEQRDFICFLNVGREFAESYIWAGSEFHVQRQRNAAGTKSDSSHRQQNLCELRCSMERFPIHGFLGNSNQNGVTISTLIGHINGGYI